mgnify:CR=1 FL=1
MDYQPPTLCVRSVIPSQDEGKFLLDMPSLWFDDGPVEVSKEVVDYIMIDPYRVPMCPPGYPVVPQET